MSVRKQSKHVSTPQHRLTCSRASVRRAVVVRCANVTTHTFIYSLIQLIVSIPQYNVQRGSTLKGARGASLTKHGLALFVRHLSAAPPQLQSISQSPTAQRRPSACAKPDPLAYALVDCPQA
jgi:hypothetical protein